MFWLTGRSNFSFWAIPHHSPTYILMFWGQNQFFPPQIQLVGRRTGAVLTRRMATYNEVVFTKVASNHTTWWHNHSKLLSRLPCPPMIHLMMTNDEQRNKVVIESKMNEIQQYMGSIKLKLNAEKTKIMVMSTKQKLTQGPESIPQRCWDKESYLC